MPGAATMARSPSRKTPGYMAGRFFDRGAEFTRNGDKHGRQGIYAVSFLAKPATYSPWKRAIFSSRAVGWREPSPPASVEAP
ncbi:hypothetical protein C8D96_2531 [Kushneria marisflavi]|nr:hypothetical protein C8D96_2531 [Kushneria marisflavi]